MKRNAIPFFALLMIAGCQTTTHVIGQADTPSPRVQTKVTGAQAFDSNAPVSADDAVGTDPCEARLQNIEAALLLYYSVNKSLPPRLEDLVSLANDDLPLACPVSNQEYLYMKGGLPVPGSDRQIIVCDPTPAHQGKRWCIVMAPAIPGGALELEPQKLPESVFKDLQLSP